MAIQFRHCYFLRHTHPPLFQALVIAVMLSFAGASGSLLLIGNKTRRLGTLRRLYSVVSFVSISSASSILACALFLEIFRWVSSGKFQLKQMNENHADSFQRPNPYFCLTTMHVLRDCSSIQSLWLQLLPSTHWVTFFSLEMDIWMERNLAEAKIVTQGLPWNIIFGVTIWWAWKWRNESIFQDSPTTSGPLSSIIKYAQDILEAEKVKAKMNPDHIPSDHIGWLPPPINWIKVNSDGSLKRDTNLASAGGLIRDEEGRWLGGFTHLLGYCSSNMAEVWGAVDGLELAWNKGYRQVILEMDSQLVVDTFNGRNRERGALQLDNLMDHLAHMLCWEWEVQIRHTKHEGNRCADKLANLAHANELGLIVLSNPPTQIYSDLFADATGICWPRGA